MARGVLRGRKRAHDAVGQLEVPPRQAVSYRGTQFTEMDVDGVIARQPKLAPLDEFAHTNVPGVRHQKRWPEVEMLLDHGVDVMTTLNIQHPESLNDPVARARPLQQETVADAVAEAEQPAPVAVSR
jgi:two-component system, OmpR family, sensor histidine kinase KdpD